MCLPELHSGGSFLIEILKLNIMKRFLEKLQVVAFVAMIVFASGDTYANLVAVVTAAAILGCCELKLKELADD